MTSETEGKLQKTLQEEGGRKPAPGPPSGEGYAQILLSRFLYSTTLRDEGIINFLHKRSVLYEPSEGRKKKKNPKHLGTGNNLASAAQISTVLIR